MKNKIIVIVLSILCLCGCTSETKISEGDILKARLALKDVADNNYPFITKEYGKTFFKDLTDINKKGLSYSKYALVDFDQDGYDEILLDLDSNYNLYMILRYTEEHVYGYIVKKSKFYEIKESGEYSYIDDKGIEEYFSLAFNEEKYAIVLKAIKNDNDKFYVINSHEVKKEEVDKYIKEFDKKTTIKWIENSSIE